MSLAVTTEVQDSLARKCHQVPGAAGARDLLAEAMVGVSRRFGLRFADGLPHRFRIENHGHGSLGAMDADSMGLSVREVECLDATAEIDQVAVESRFHEQADDLPEVKASGGGTLDGFASDILELRVHGFHSFVGSHGPKLRVILDPARTKFSFLPEKKHDSRFEFLFRNHCLT